MLRDAARRADGITTISEDVATMLYQERIPVEHDRVFPVLYGTEHIGGHEDASFPHELAAKGRLAEQFVVCLGTDYAHKNRDLAVAVHRELAERGRRVEDVLALDGLDSAATAELAADSYFPCDRMFALENGRYQIRCNCICPGYIDTGMAQRYFDLANSLKASLMSQDGFVSIERFESVSQPGRFLSLSFWRDEAAVSAWRNMA